MVFTSLRNCFTNHLFCCLSMLRHTTVLIRVCLHEVDFWLIFAVNVDLCFVLLLVGVACSIQRIHIYIPSQAEYQLAFFNTDVARIGCHRYFQLIFKTCRTQISNNRNETNLLMNANSEAINPNSKTKNTFLLDF